MNVNKYLDDVNVVIPPNKLIGRFLYYNKDTEKVEQFMLLYFKDIESGSTFSKCSVLAETLEFGEMEINITDREKYNRIAKSILEVPLVFEKFNYENYENLGENEYNTFYFIEYTKFLKEEKETSEDRVVKGFSFESAIENEIMCEHNVEYDILEYNEEGEVIEPTNFNQIYYKNKMIGDIIHDLYIRNLIIPVDRVYGKSHGVDDLRKAKGFAALNYYPEDYFGRSVTYLTDKKTLTEARRELYQIHKNSGDNFLPNIEIKLVEGVFELSFNFTNTITINKEINRNRIISESREIDFSTSTNDVLIESDKIDLVSVRKTRIRPNVWKLKERLETNSPDEGEEETPNPIGSNEYEEPLVTKAYEILGNGTPKDVLELEIIIKGLEYFVEIDTNKIIKLVNFGNEFDGQYRIDKISAVIEETYISYSIEKLTKIEESEE